MNESLDKTIQCYFKNVNDLSTSLKQKKTLGYLKYYCHYYENLNDFNIQMGNLFNGHLIFIKIDEKYLEKLIKILSLIFPIDKRTFFL